MADHKDLMYITQIERCAVKDGPGIRTTVFFQGCPLHCFWCCNPETQPFESVWMYDEKKCLHCGTCVSVCNNHSLSVSDGKLINTKCVGCHACEEACPGGAICFSSKPYTVDDIVKEVLKDEIFYKATGGGVTLSGGEPLCQNAVIDLLKKLSVNNINTFVETTANVSRKAVEASAEFIDGYYIDFKHPNPEILKEKTGADLFLIKNNIEYLVKNGNSVTLRTPVVPGFNNDLETIKQCFDYAVSLELKEYVLLPYHSLGKNKYSMLNRTYPCPELKTLTKDDLTAFVKSGEKIGLKVRTLG